MSCVTMHLLIWKCVCYVMNGDGYVFCVARKYHVQRERVVVEMPASIYQRRQLEDVQHTNQRSNSESHMQFVSW